MKREGLVKMRLHLDLQSPSWSPKDTRPLESDTHLLVAYIDILFSVNATFLYYNLNYCLIVAQSDPLFVVLIL
jgi:hypothetical protein